VFDRFAQRIFATQANTPPWTIVARRKECIAMKLDPMTLMWIQVATGAMGMLTLVYLWRGLQRKLGFILEIRAYFSPKGGCQEAIVAEIKKARSEILVQAYSFTADPLTFGLVDAKKNGVTVEIVLDKSNELERYSDLKILMENSMDVKIDHDHAIAHNKIIIIDKKILITGSYNFTNQAEHENAENLMIIKGHPELVSWYRDNFFKHRDHSKPAQIKEGEQKDRRQQGGHAQHKAA
jgi:phosphatidylserine/phosphatidylglycerophosphate/cardiolipin synthase-like enzyme